MPEQYVVTLDGHEITPSSAPRAEALQRALAIVDVGGPGSEIAIAESQTLQVFACWRRTPSGWHLVGAAPQWLGGGDEP